ncbi:MAG: tRNA (guanosine(46)-N7)-methyltransferase TrmB [Treponema sp.]|nr:tRNA (guanosine(46)-N7)-methyltransferase TrmB [Treponema sp.]
MLKSFVIRQGWFTDAQKKAYESLSPRYMLPVSFDQLSSSEEKLNYKDIFGNTGNVILEIGFGSGFATAEIAKANPEKNYIGIEVHKPGIGRLLWEIEKQNLNNIRIIEYDAVPVLEKIIAPESLDAVHVFFPDPWPKKKHHKRRLVQLPFTLTLAKCLKQGGYLYMVTDWEDYALYALEELSATEGLKNNYDGFADSQTWRPRTRFEQKGLDKEHIIRELYFTKG